MVPTCSTCYAYRPDDDGTIGRCRINPPMVRDGNHTDHDGVYDPEGCWPSVHPEDWCAEHGEPDDDPDPDDDPGRQGWVTLGLLTVGAALAGRVSRR